MHNTTIYPSIDEFVHGAAKLVTELALAAVTATGRFTVALAGGSTPRPIYALLASPQYAGTIAWDRVQVFFGDERCVPPDDARSNYRMACDTLLDHVPLPRGNVHRILGEADPGVAALAYEQELRRLFGTQGPPALDLICLGLGDDGHTASLFPGAASSREHIRWVMPQYVEAIQAWRVTVTPVLINAARNVVFLVAGAGKAEILARVLAGPHEPDLLPAQRIQPHDGQVHWLVDPAAGARIELGPDVSDQG